MPARKTAMLVCALAVMPIVFASIATNFWVAVAPGRHWRPPRTRAGRRISSRSRSDMFPRQAVGTVVGFGGMAGAVGGMLIAKLTGYILEATGSYVVVFLIAASAYLAALAVIHLLLPKLEPAPI